MRFSPLVLVLGLAASSMAVPVSGQRGDDQVSPVSVQFQKKGETAYSAGRFNEASDALETALVADPKNRAAFVALARVAIKQKLNGKAIRLTNKALAIEPTDRAALAVQGEAMVEAGASARAKDVLAKLQKVCAAPCAEAGQLSTLIARGPTLAAAKPATGVKKN
jgi:predicted Zn-dependent protease